MAGSIGFDFGAGTGSRRATGAHGRDGAGGMGVRGVSGAGSCGAAGGAGDCGVAGGVGNRGAAGGAGNWGGPDGAGGNSNGKRGGAGAPSGPDGGKREGAPSAAGDGKHGGAGGNGDGDGDGGIREFLLRRTLLCDGAFGTYYDTLLQGAGTGTATGAGVGIGAGAGEPVELANIRNGALVRRIHAEYIESGAGMIRTNTFGANEPNLRCGRERLREIVAAGFGLAAEAAGRDAFVAASIGPVFCRDAGEAASEYRFVAEEFLAAGAGILLFETLDDCDAVLQALRGIKRGGAGEPFVILSFCVNRYGYTDSGASAKRLVRELSERGEVDCIGFNCGAGPLHLHRVLSGIELGARKFSMVLPNAGYPDAASNRYSYQNNVGYFAEWLSKIRELGADIIGGCCGTTPQYTRAIRACLPPGAGRAAPARWMQPGGAGRAEGASVGGPRGEGAPETAARQPESGARHESMARQAQHGGMARQAQPESRSPEAQPASPMPYAQPASPLLSEQPAPPMPPARPARRAAPFFEAAAKARGRIVAAELDPPMNANSTKIMEDAIRLRNMGVDILTFADSPAGRARADSFLIASKVLSETGVAVMPHICCRDKNEIAVRAQILGAHICGVRSVLAVTGDPVPRAGRSSARGVFNFDSVKLMRLIGAMNDELFAGDPVYFGGAINQSRRLDAETERVKRKLDAGAAWFLTQPVYGDEDIDALLSVKEKTGAAILCGLMPLISRKNALFVRNELPGIRVPDAVLDRYSDGMDRAEGEEAGVLIAREIAARAVPPLDGYYIVLPFNRTGLVSRILA